MRHIILSVLTLVAISSGYAQNGLHFDGVNDYVDGGNDPSVQITGSLITLEAWIYPTGWQPEFWRGNIINKEDDNDNSGYMLRCGEGGKLNFNFGNGTWHELTSTTAVLSLFTWQHVAGTYDGSTMRIYVDGVEVGSSATTGAISNTGATKHLTIGNWSYAAADRGFEGTIDDARVWNVARSAIDINANMNHELCYGTPGLVAYYKFNEGVAFGNNTGISTTVDFTANSNDGTLVGFSGTSVSSNFVNGIIANHTEGVDVVSVCDNTPYTWMNGLTYNSANSIATHTLTNMYGCDSVVTLNLTFNNANSGTDVQSACVGSTFTWIDGLDYFVDNNSATSTVTNSAGCDSVVTLNLTFYNSTTGVDVISACGDYEWIDGITYTSNNNSATHTIMNSHGCDSVVTLNLTINSSTQGVDVQFACEDAYEWIDGNTYTTDNNSAIFTINNGASNGCDSIVTLDLTFVTIDTDVTTTDPTISSNEIDANYRWLNCDDNYSEIVGEQFQSYTALVNGTYAVELTKNSCVDTSECITILTVGIDESDIESSISVYPNPSNNHIVVSFDMVLNNGSVLIEDLTGKQVYSQQNINTELIKIDLSDLSEGIYLLKVNNNGQEKVIKLLKK